MPLLSPITPASARLVMAVRLLQLLLALAYFVLLIYSFQNKGWWLNLSTPVTIGSITFLATDMSTIYLLCTKPLSRDGRVSAARLVLLAALDVLLAACWVATFAVMWIPKGKDYKQLFSRPPYVFWHVATALAAIEIVMFSSAVWLTWKRGRAPYTTASVPRAVPLADLGATPAGPYERM